MPALALACAVAAAACGGSGEGDAPGTEGSTGLEANTSSDGGALADAGSSGGSETGATPWVPEPGTIPARTAVRHCRFGAGSEAPRIGAGPDEGDVPTKLSTSGCFLDGAAAEPAPDLLPYQINAPLWTDGAAKRRYIVLPPGTTIVIAEDGRWDFPVGAAILKVFSPLTFEGDPESERPAEVRVMIRRALDWQFVTYMFDADGEDATRTDGGFTVELPVVVDGEDATKPYYYPDDEACRICHRDDGERQVLGPRTDQLDRVLDYGGEAVNQIEAMWQAGWIAAMPAARPMADAMPAPEDVDADPEARARAYLHANCSHCHRAGGWQPAGVDIDLRFEIPLAQTGICGVPLEYWSPWAGGRQRLAPGDLLESNIYQRMSMRGDGQMPLFGTYEVDPTGVAVMRDWIEALEGCPEPEK
jgi:uncharacterized repeat protein (TIGR03806 family)